MDHKNHTIGEHEYRIGRLSASDGSSLYLTFLQAYRADLIANPRSAIKAVADPDVPMPPPEVGFLMTASFLVEQLDRKGLAELFSICLEKCGRYNHATGKAVALPIVQSDGRFAIPDLEFDGPTLLELVQQTVAFNIAPFFPGAGSSGTMPAADSNEPTTRP
jgi:hypothetical protein